MGRRPVSVSSRPEERSLLSISWPSVHPLERTLFSFRASALPVWPIVTSVPPVFPTPPPGLWSGPRDASSSVHVVAGHPEDTRSRSHNHHICVFANRLGICRYQPSSVSVKRG